MEACGVSLLLIAWGCLVVFSILTSVYFIKFAFVAGISSVTSAYAICQRLNATANITCPVPWKYDSWGEAVTSMNDMANILYPILIVLIILSCIFGTFSSHRNERSGYTSV